MNKQNTPPRSKVVNRFRHTACRSVICLLLIGCSGLYNNLPPAPPETSLTVEGQTETPAPQTSTPGPEQTSLPISEVTNLPGHAPTITPLSEPVETGTGGQLSGQTAVPAEPDEPPPDLSALIDPDATFKETEIQIYRPGPYSLLASPFRITANLAPGANNLVQLHLVGEDGRTLVEKSLKVVPWIGQTTAKMTTEIEFEIEALSELARLEISVDDEFGRLKALNSVDVILLSTSESNYNYAIDVQERVVVHYPFPDHMIQGDTLLVSGLVRATTEKPLDLELYSETGELIGSGSAAVLIPADSGYGLFAGEIKYAISEPVWVLLTIHIPGERIPGTAYVKSIGVVLSP